MHRPFLKITKKYPQHFQNSDSTRYLVELAQLDEMLWGDELGKELTNGEFPEDLVKAVEEFSTGLPEKAKKVLENPENNKPGSFALASVYDILFKPSMNGSKIVEAFLHTHIEHPQVKQFLRKHPPFKTLLESLETNLKKAQEKKSTASTLASPSTTTELSENPSEPLPHASPSASLSGNFEGLQKEFIVAGEQMGYQLEQLRKVGAKPSNITRMIKKISDQAPEVLSFQEGEPKTLSYEGKGNGDQELVKCLLLMVPATSQVIFETQAEFERVSTVWENAAFQEMMKTYYGVTAAPAFSYQGMSQNPCSTLNK